MTEQVTEHIDLSKYSDEDRAAIEAMQEQINLGYSRHTCKNRT